MASATNAPKKHEWIVIIPDQEGALERRLKVRQQHFDNLKPNIDSGFLLFGGSFLDEPAVEGQPLKMKGSILLALAESKEELVKNLKEDIYTKSDVWDWDKAQIYPFKSALRKPLDVNM